MPTRDFETWGSEAPVAYLLVEPRPLGEPDPELRHLPLLLIGLARKMTPAQVVVELALIAGVMRTADDEELDRAVRAAAAGLLLWMGYPDPEGMMEKANGTNEVAEHFQRGLERMRNESRLIGHDEGRALGRNEGRRTTLRRIAARRFGSEAAREFGKLLDGVNDPGRLDAASDAIVDCDGAEELLGRTRSLAAGS